jgi:hypothetical protein
VLLIRKEQMEALSQHASASFRERAFEHIKKCVPREFEAKGPAAAWQSIDKAIAKAAGYGIEMERDVVRYLDTMYLVGEDFDVDPNIPWARPILESPNLTPSVKALRLWECAKSHPFPLTDLSR